MVEVRYQLPNYNDLMKNFPCPVFNVIGNHDNDPKVVGDYFTELPFKQHIAPTYYSFNIGDVHYIVLDNDQYDNYNGGSRIGADRAARATPTRRNGRWRGWPKT